MTTSEVESILNNLGITRGLKSTGQSVWTLRLTDTDDATRIVFFDERLSIWRFADADNEDKQVSEDIQGHGYPSRPIQKVLTKKPKTHDSLLRSDSWIDVLPQSKHTAFFISRNWAETPLGPLHDWPYALRLHTTTLFSDPRPGGIYWGDERIAIYNEGMVPVIGPLHPRLMGKTFEIEMPEMWDQFGPMFESIRQNGMGIVGHVLEVPIVRSDYLEETYWDGGLVGLKDDNGSYGGTTFSWIEVTRSTVLDRRTKLIGELAKTSAIDSDSVWQHLHDAFATDPRDIPFAVLYAVDPDAENSLILKHRIGIREGHPASPATIDMSESDEVFTMGTFLRRARDSTANHLTFSLGNGEMYANIFKDVTWLGHGEPSRNITTVCLRTRNVVTGYALFGLNPRREFDEDHKQFVFEISRQLNEVMTEVAMIDLNRQRNRELQQALKDSERLMDKLVQMAPVGIYELSMDGTLTWANGHFFDLFNVPQDRRDPSLFKWSDYILPEDQENANMAMYRSMMEKVEITDTLRLTQRWKPPGVVGEHDEPCWILYSASPDLFADGSVRALMGTLTNISHLKWAETLQARNAADARKERRRQEEFIDVISHEMRNPLSAITQCADSILTSSQEVGPDSSSDILLEIVKQNAEAAESVSFCASHQKRIIDDVLALSKLDSGMLNVTPISFRLDRLVDQTLQMFRGEFAASNIEVRVISDLDKIPLGAKVYGDSARMTQIVVNLLTNAIKFTRTEDHRTIMIRYGMNYAPPDETLFGDTFKWQPTDKKRLPVKEGLDLGDSIAVYPYFAVSDTGKGIAGDSTERVFCKFEQADQKTHVNYGGSGLGLFISRELAEIQGGLIGIESTAAIGSTFAFYTKAKLLKGHILNGGATSTRSSEDISTTHQLSTGLRILLVEDNLLNQRVLAKLLTKVGCLVFVANHGGEAIDFVLQTLKKPAEYASHALKNAPERFDCILMDWEMPICNGLDATKRIREAEFHGGSLVNIIIGITANAREDQITTALEAGMDSILSKPFRVDDVLNRIQDVMRSRDHGSLQRKRKESA